MDLAARASRSGIQEWLSFYFKAPQTTSGAKARHDLFGSRIVCTTLSGSS